MHTIYTHLNREEAETYGLVLSASGLTEFTIGKDPEGWHIRVDESFTEPARQCIEAYRRENPARLLTPAADAPLFPQTLTAVWVSLILIAAFFATGSGAAFEAMADLCGASALEIVNGAVYRTATALMLHATPAHLAGNIAGIAVFGTAVCAVAGPGVGWLMILLTGIAGNLATAVAFRSAHLSVGASTAVFGAVGILSVYQFHRKIGMPGKRVRAWLPVAGGLALLGFLGTGPHTDLAAHLFGFAAGMGIGAIWVRGRVHRPGSRTQIACMALSVGLLAGSWIWAFFDG